MPHAHDGRCTVPFVSDQSGASSMIACDPLSKEDGSRVAPRTGDRLNRALARAGRLLFTHRLEIGLGVTAVAAPFVKPTVAKTPAQRLLKAGGFLLVLIGFGLRL